MLVRRSAALRVAGTLTLGILLTGCSGAGPGDDASTTQDASPSASSPTTPSPTSTLTAAEQQAFEEATEVVLAYRQTITDLYSGARTNLNDLNDVATGDLRDQGLQNIQKSLGEGWRYEPAGAQVRLVTAEPVKVDLQSNPQLIVIQACLDTTGITGVDPEGKRIPGVREELEYTVVRTTYLPDPGWAVKRVSTDITDAEDRQC